MTTDQAFTDYYREHFPSIVRLVRPITPDAAEDVAQDAFALLYERWDLVSAYELPWAWVALVAKRLAVRRAGREARRVPIEHLSWSDGDPSPDPDVWAALATLPSRQATALVLHHVLDRPMSDVADRLGCTESAARVLVHRSRRRIAEPLSGYTGRWISEATWTVDALAAHLRASDAAAHVDVVVDGHLLGRGGRWEFVLDRGSYLLQREDGLRLDDGTFVI